MTLKKILLSAFIVSALCSEAADFRYVGGDISLLPNYEAAGSQYKDQNGQSITLLPYLYDLGMNAMRVRLFVDPGAFEAAHPNDYDPNACQSLPYIIPLCKDIVNAGFDLMLDFHYSDTWADPVAQWIPDAWKNLTDAQLVEKIYEYTSETLQTLKAEGIVPKFIQPGNEISYGMLWSEYGHDIPGNHVYSNSSQATWQRFGDFLKSAISACRTECPQAEIVIHTERVAQVNVLTNFYDKMASLNIDYDIIGLSYYPYFHGPMNVLNSALTTLENRYPDKPIMIVETGCPIWWAIGDADKQYYAYTLEGQNQFAEELVATLLNHPNVNGLFWWWLEYNPYGTQLQNWYNAPLFDPKTGRATPALYTICSFGTGHGGVEMIGDELLNGNSKWYDLQGRSYAYPQTSGIYIHEGKKVLVKP